jgi:hypothetical protein
VPALRQVIAADCARMIEGKISDPWRGAFSRTGDVELHPVNYKQPGDRIKTA